MHFSKVFFVAALALPCLSAVVPSHTVDDVKKDLASISNQASVLNAAIHRISANNADMNQVMINSLVSSFVASVNQGAADVKSVVSLSESNDQGILATSQTIDAIIKDSLATLVQNKAALDTMGASDDVRQNLATLAQNSASLADAMIAASPDAHKADAMALKSDLMSAFDAAVQAFN